MAYTKRGTKGQGLKNEYTSIELVILKHKPFSKNEKRISGFGFEQLQSIGKSMVKYTISRQSAYCSTLAQMEVTFEDLTNGIIEGWSLSLTLQYSKLSHPSMTESRQREPWEFWPKSGFGMRTQLMDSCSSSLSEKKWFHLLQKHEKFLTEMEKKWIGVTATGPKKTQKNMISFTAVYCCRMLQTYIIYHLSYQRTQKESRLFEDPTGWENSCVKAIQWFC